MAFLSVSWWPGLDSQVIPLSRVTKVRHPSSKKATRKFTVQDLQRNVWIVAKLKSSVQWARIITCGTEEEATNGLYEVIHRPSVVDHPPPSECRRSPMSSPGLSNTPTHNLSFTAGSPAKTPVSEGGHEESFHYTESQDGLARQICRSLRAADNIPDDSIQSAAANMSTHLAERETSAIPVTDSMPHATIIANQERLFKSHENITRCLNLILARIETIERTVGVTHSDGHYDISEIMEPEHFSSEGQAKSASDDISIQYRPVMNGAATEVDAMTTAPPRVPQLDFW